jgi:hypothetical protein
VDEVTPVRLLKTAIIPALTELASTGIPDTLEARRFLLAIALQESGLRHRRQVVSGGIENGPASSFWQMEKGGGCKGVLTHPAVAQRMKQVCQDYNVDATAGGLWEAMRYQDIVAAAAARLLFYVLPDYLPTTADAGWKQYIEAWRPGKPHPGTWTNCWSTAGNIVREFT